jgi:hypothetical protein
LAPLLVYQHDHAGIRRNDMVLDSNRMQIVEDIQIAQVATVALHFSQDHPAGGERTEIFIAGLDEHIDPFCSAGEGEPGIPINHIHLAAARGQTQVSCQRAALIHCHCNPVEGFFQAAGNTAAAGLNGFQGVIIVTKWKIIIQVYQPKWSVRY